MENDLLLRENVRGNGYKFLAECYYLPDEKLIETLGRIKKSDGTVSSEISKNIPGMSEIEALRIDYAKLFLGPYKLLAPPYGSIYLEGNSRVMGDSAIDVRNRYLEAGLDVSGETKEAPDHITIELEFMCFLVFKEIEMIKNSNFESALDYLKKQKEFLDGHLGAWVSEFSDNIEKNAETEFYKNLSRATRSFIKKDTTELAKKFIDFSEVFK